VLHAQAEKLAATAQFQLKNAEDELTAAVLRAPPNSNSITLEGRTYEIGKEGLVRVPTRFVKDLEAHGFTLVR
jgi:hypothetical protein